MTYDLLAAFTNNHKVTSTVTIEATAGIINDLRLRQAVLFGNLAGQLGKQHGLPSNMALGHLVAFDVPEGYLVRHGTPPRYVRDC